MNCCSWVEACLNCVSEAQVTWCFGGRRRFSSSQPLRRSFAWHRTTVMSIWDTILGQDSIPCFGSWRTRISTKNQWKVDPSVLFWAEFLGWDCSSFPLLFREEYDLPVGGSADRVVQSGFLAAFWQIQNISKIWDSKSAMKLHATPDSKNFLRCRL